MLKKEYQSLEFEGVKKLTESDEIESTIVQIYNLNLNNKGRLSCMVSDGKFQVKGQFKEKGDLSPQKNQFSIVRIKNHAVADSGKKIGIVQFELICEYSKKIGNPTVIDSTEHNLEETVNLMLDLNCIKSNKQKICLQQQKQTKKQQNNNALKPTNTIQQKSQKQPPPKKETKVLPPQPFSGAFKDYQTVKGLYVGLKTWHLLCRVIKVDYKEFIKKGSDKEMKVLNVQLIDKSEVTVCGAFFHEAAVKFREFIEVGHVYKISNGTITNQTYNNSKNEKMSPFRLLFNVNSIFEEVSDVNIIAKPEDSAQSVGDIMRKEIYNQEFDIVGILVQIEEQKEYNKDDKVLKKVDWVIADPIEKKTIVVTFWNTKQNDSNLVGKALLLNHFVLKNYHGFVSLNNRPRSTIQQLPNHDYARYEEQVMSQYKQYEKLSVKKYDTKQTEKLLIGDIMNTETSNQEYEVVGILVDIEEPKEYSKDEKIMKKVDWVIADPIEKKTVHVTFWNAKQSDESDKMGKVILFKNFTIKNYNGFINLNSRLRSTVEKLPNHEFSKYEESVMTEYKQYQKISIRKYENKESQKPVPENVEKAATRNIQEVKDILGMFDD